MVEVMCIEQMTIFVHYPTDKVTLISADMMS